MKVAVVSLIGLIAFPMGDPKTGHPQAHTVSEIIASSTAYVGRKVTVRGYVLLRSQDIFSASLLIESKSAMGLAERQYKAGNPSSLAPYCLRLENAEKLERDPHRFDHKTLELTGIVRVDHNLPTCGSGWALELE
jgi:hypothetical protein